MNRKHSGFTLIELLVVVLIIGILSAVALPQYQKAVLKSRVSSFLPKVDALIKSLQLFYLENGNYPKDTSSLVIDTGEWVSTSNLSYYIISKPIQNTIKWEIHFHPNRIIAYCASIDSNELGKYVCKQYWDTNSSEGVLDTAAGNF